MDELIEQLRELTIHMAKHAEAASADELLEFVTRREQLVVQIGRVESTLEQRLEYRDIIRAILDLDAVVNGKLQAYKEEAAKELTKLNAAKQQRSLYEADHGSYSDGLFFDKRK